jgi:nitrate reductase cytochrome c-type subunit
MYFLYADESGDIGLDNSPSRYFCLNCLFLKTLAMMLTIRTELKLTG